MSSLVKWRTSSLDEVMASLLEECVVMSPYVVGEELDMSLMSEELSESAHVTVVNMFSLSQK